MNTDDFKRKMIEQLKAEKARTGLSNQSIAELTESIGMSVSLRTVNKVFSPPPDAYSVKMCTIFALAQAMDVELIGDDLAEQTMIEKQVVEIQITELKKQLADKDEQIENMRRIESSHEAYINVQLKRLEDKDKRITILTASCGLIMLAIVVMLMWYHISLMH